MIFHSPPPDVSQLRAGLRAVIRQDETAAVRARLDRARLSASQRTAVDMLARRLVEGVRASHRSTGGIEAFLLEYSLSSQEGVVLMCLAEALLRIPDAETADRLIQDKLGSADWRRHLGQSESALVNASTWGLMLTGRIIRLGLEPSADVGGFLAKLAARLGEPVIRRAMSDAMRIVGRQFVMGATIAAALARAAPAEARGFRHSYDMLGEAARTAADADRYCDAYAQAIAAIGATARGDDVATRPGISVKLSALHPRFEPSQRARVMDELVPRLKELAQAAAARNVGFCVDAEEADRLDLSLDVIEALALDRDLAGWNGYGLAVQAYNKRAPTLIAWLADLARRGRRRLMLRLVKGAYWDTEIKRAQEGGHDGYPVYTRKAATDVAYLACARLLLADAGAFYPQFATHNAHTVAAITVLAGQSGEYEFQRLHGMGEALYGEAAKSAGIARACRIYAPVGGQADLLAYLVRRLLENGANTSFVNRIVDERLSIDDIVADPASLVEALPVLPHPRIPLPGDLFAPERRNSRGLDLNDMAVLAALAPLLSAAARANWHAAPLVGGKPSTGPARALIDPADLRRRIGTVVEANAADIERALDLASDAAADWNGMGGEGRAAILERVADLFEERRVEFMALCVREAGKCLPDALAELREAVDYCRYYAAQARRDFAEPRLLPGPTGERNEIALAGRGLFACISPWNFPLAIFTGQIAAALAAGNTVLAKPAEQTPLIAMFAVELMHQAGVPPEVLHFLPGAGETVGAALVRDARIDGIAFTGGTDTAHLIQQALAARPGPIVPFIAETGGLNVMLADSTALPEQVVADALRSAFNSAGQRCSALRVLMLQDDIYDKTARMLAGAMAELAVGDPGLIETDIGPLIDQDACRAMTEHARRMAAEGQLLAEARLGPDCAHGHFFAPCAVAIDRLGLLRREVFGPILHVMRFEAERLDQVIDAVNATGYGLTMGVHSRIDATIARIKARAKVGNLYVNRNMIGAVVGVQPFGGEGLSGTGPKAGGPRYLHRFAVERTVSTDTTASGGNVALLSLDAEDG